VFNVGSPELLVILLVALIVLGPNKLPEVARQVGRAMSEIRKLSAGFQAELRDAMEDPVPSQPTSLPVEPAVTPEPPLVAETIVDLDVPTGAPAGATPPDEAHEPIPDASPSAETENHDEVPPA
jgi:sec-independent protein translocase protein TatB